MKFGFWSGADRFDRGNSLYQNDGEKNQQPQSHANTRNNIPDHHGDAGSSSLLNDNSSPHTLIPLEGCCRSEASQLLNDRMHTPLLLLSRIKIKIYLVSCLFSSPI